MKTTPPVTPVTIPVLTTDATEALELDQMPPGVALVSVICAPAQTDPGPAMATGVDVTVTIEVAAHPLAIV